MVGPTIQNDLLSILLRFRTHNYVVAADIAKMYRQVLVKPEQRSLQRILWRNNPSDPIETYELQTVTYGTSSAAFLAIRSLYQLALDHEKSHPAASTIIKEDFYVDDLLFSSDSVEEASRIGLELMHILRSGCFELRKWHSNASIIVKNITSKASITDNVIEIGTSDSSKTLGLAWSSKDDTLKYNISLKLHETRVTKRIILSCVSQIFDPLGLLSPCVVSAKILLQKLWLEKLSWDESVPQSIHTAWLRLRTEISLLDVFQIPRNTVCCNPKFIEIHCFSDASEAAYGASIYVRSINQDGQTSVHLLCSKTKVAPLKVITLPRLELCGAVLSARLAKKVQTSLRLHVNNIIFWTDSTIVLGWIRLPPNVLKTFVANRVSEIQQLTSDRPWRHISSKSNPADILSRGMSPTELQNCALWWHGPQWLNDDEYAWPDSKIIIENTSELKTQALISLKHESIIDFNKFSSFNRLRHTVAYVFRFIHNCQNFKEKLTGILSVEELQNAFSFLLKESQRDSFADEINFLSKNKSISAKSQIFNLNPFLDNSGLLRVCGRLKNSNFHRDKIHPIIIHAKHPLCKLIFKYEHVKMLHAGPQLLLSNIRETLWPIRGRNLAKLIVRECVICFRFNPKSMSPLMGHLPERRLDAGFPFKVCGVDYAGPFLIKNKGGRSAMLSKCYLALFVCFSTKAIHLELVSDLSTNAFLLALKRFMSRRGKPIRIYSDNGTNFVGANAELRDLGNFIKNNGEQMSESCAEEGIEWRFIPVNSPHFGGLWEAGVKASKYHLKRVIGRNVLTFEEMYTVFVQIEGILNSRPISPLSTDPNDLSPLTPAHFLMAKAMTWTPEPPLEHLPVNRLSRYQLLEQMRQNFWTRWSKEYISELQQRTKWRETQQHAAQGTLVLIKEDNLPPLRWKMGRIVSIHPGKDGIPRVASIRTTSGITKRACQKLCPLPIEDNVESGPFQGGGHVGDSK
ncbi:uncharacterized protein LOC126740435 [Anthonomus grandis grandis]|uniref:uncharacterized protein LOC126740435 n=1 Tax=Anthonomus grandis grandis TaxID=2921223 RepID=UPI00216563F6|nr:uncharacterized protein LOC126740435 [Anthonomus grandis grandis]